MAGQTRLHLFTCCQIAHTPVSSEVKESQVQLSKLGSNNVGHVELWLILKVGLMFSCRRLIVKE